MAAAEEATTLVLEGDDDGDWEPLEPSLQNIIDQRSLKWVFVGGKGGVGKTTTSCCLAVRLAAARSRVLVVSTDPAHNLSDAFDQKFTNKPTQIKNFENLFAMEVDPTANEGGQGGNFFQGLLGQAGMAQGQDEEATQESMGFMKDLMASVPGIDEATSFGEVIKSLDEYNFDLIIFDTAPTGHTLRLLNFPNILEKGLVKLIELKDKFGGMFA